MASTFVDCYSRVMISSTSVGSVFSIARQTCGGTTMHTNISLKYLFTVAMVMHRVNINLTPLSTIIDR